MERPWYHQLWSRVRSARFPRVKKMRNVYFYLFYLFSGSTQELINISTSSDKICDVNTKPSLHLYKKLSININILNGIFFSVIGAGFSNVMDQNYERPPFHCHIIEKKD